MMILASLKRIGEGIARALLAFLEPGRRIVDENGRRVRCFNCQRRCRRAGISIFFKCEKCSRYSCGRCADQIKMWKGSWVCEWCEVALERVL